MIEIIGKVKDIDIGLDMEHKIVDFDRYEPDQDWDEGVDFCLNFKQLDEFIEILQRVKEKINNELE